MRNSLIVLAMIACSTPSPTSGPGTGSAAVDLAPAGSWNDVVNAGIANTEYQLATLDDGRLRYTNRAQDLRGFLDEEGMVLQARSVDAEWRLGLRTVAIGREAMMPTVLGAVHEGACASEQKDVYGDCLKRAERSLGQHTVAWWANSTEGVQQGWTIAEEPVGTGPLQIDVAVDGFDAEVGPDGLSAVLRSGEVSMTYGGLMAWDANGTMLGVEMVERDGGVRLVVDLEGASFPVTVDPVVASPSWTAESDQTSASFGYSVSGAGDVNGDGFDDVVVGADRYDNGESNEGRSYLYLGGASGLSASPSWTAESDQAFAGFGFSVSGAGDVNGDGFDDVVVGARRYDNGETDEGRSYLYLGGASGLSASPSWTAESDQGGAWFGHSVSGAGDVNGDGFDDVVVGARYHGNGESTEGRSYLYLGGASGLSASPSWTAESDQSGAQFGTSVSGAGDVNGDGFDDVVVGSPFYDNGESAEGRSYLYLGGASGLSASPSWTAESDQATPWFGWSVSGAGDVNGDGFDDVVVGAPFYDNGESDEGRSYLYLGGASGLSASPSWTAESDQSGAQFGRSVSGAGDVNGDGFDDVVVGARRYGNGETDEGRSYLYLGGASGLSASPSWTAESDQPFAEFGYSVSGAGDVNGDGADDLIIGSFWFDNGPSDEGAAFLYLGILANEAPLAIAGGPYAADEGAPLALDGSASTDDTGVAVYRWDCTDDGSYDVTGETASCTYPDDGTYTVRLQVEDASGLIDEDTATVTIDNADPLLTGFPARTGDAGVPLTLTATATDVAADTLSWSLDCGDGSGPQSSPDGTLSCTYATAAVYTATVEVADEDGGFATTSAAITIGDAPPASVDLTQAVDDANQSWGTDVLVETSPAARLRPSRVATRIQSLTDALSQSGCVLDVAGLETAGGDYRGSAADGFWSGGVVTGVLDRPTKGFSGDFVGGSPFGSVFGAYNSQTQLIADRGANAFAAGHWIRVAGTKGVWVVVHGECVPGVHPSDALAGWSRTDLSAW